jgi:glutaredoxin
MVTRHVTLFTRKGCHLCERTAKLIEQARRQARFTLEIIDVDVDPEIHSQYHERVPVVALDGQEVFWGNIDEQALAKRLSEKGLATDERG